MQSTEPEIIEAKPGCSPLQLAAIAPRFWSRVKVGSPRECWPWQGPTVGIGHGRYDTPVGGTAHRFAWAVTNLADIPEGIVIRHTCDNPPCCNPAHLIPGTQYENVQDMIDRGRAFFSREVCRKGHPRTPDNLLFRSDGSTRCKLCERDIQAARRASATTWMCPECAGTLSTVSTLERHLRKVHGLTVSTAELRARANRIEREARSGTE